MTQFTQQDVEDEMEAARFFDGLATRLLAGGGPRAAIAGPMAEVAERHKDRAERINQLLPRGLKKE